MRFAAVLNDKESQQSSCISVTVDPATWGSVSSLNHRFHSRMHLCGLLLSFCAAVTAAAHCMIDDQTVNDRWTGWQETRTRSRNESVHAKQSRWKKVNCYVCPDSADAFSVFLSCRLTPPVLLYPKTDLVTADERSVEAFSSWRPKRSDRLAASRGAFSHEDGVQVLRIV